MPVRRAARLTDDRNGAEHDIPRDAVRRVPMPGGLIALTGFDAEGKARKTVIIEARDATPDEASALQRWVRKRYPRKGLHLNGSA